ncbi:MAG: class I SAM-dependent methyltransferase [Candidatus Berkelbacteria bacterium]|nr:class I SAM-dependent methyltransferase [Candidatus Berkelbacteria bacterium]
MPVFESYAKYYDLLYRDKNYGDEAAFVDSIIKKGSKGAKTILEMGCGTGLHAIALAQIGYSVTGIDFSEGMLMAGEKRLSILSLKEREKISLNLGDVRDFRDQKTYDSVISLFHILSYQNTNEDLIKTFKTAEAHLKKGGLFIFDCWYGPAVLTDRPSVRLKEFEDRETKIMRFADPKIYPNRNVVDVNYKILVSDKQTGKTEEISETHSMRYLFQPELELMLENAGFELVEAKEWLTDEELSFETWGACFVGRKK